MNRSRKKFFKSGPEAAKILTKLFVVIVGCMLLCGGMLYRNEFSAEGEPFEAMMSDSDAEDKDAYISMIESDAEVNEPSGDEVSFLNPVDGVLTSAFGERWGRSHKGIDIGADNGTEIYAADDGEVVFAGEMSGYGNYIVISHCGGFETAYGHCGRLFAQAGETVEKGQVIASVGSTGNSTGPHLHFEIRKDGEFINPADYVVY